MAHPKHGNSWLCLYAKDSLPSAASDGRAEFLPHNLAKHEAGTTGLSGKGLVVRSTAWTAHIPGTRIQPWLELSGCHPR